MAGGLRRLAAGEANIDFVGKIRTWMMISAIVIGLSLVGMFVRKLNFGLSFKGGTSIRAALQTNASVPDIRSAVVEAGAESPEVQIAKSPTGDREVLIQMKRVPPDRLEKVLNAVVALADLSSRDDVNVEDVGPKWGRQVSNKAWQGLIVFLVLVVAYISLRFELKMAAAAIGALFHDLISTAGIYALVGFEVSPATVVALLTILGYSLYDTVVVFDKIRENAEGLATTGRTTYGDMVNRSINEVFMRSINTSLTSLIPVGALLASGTFLVGAQQLNDLALAMLVGILVSTYSSIFFAAPILAVWKEREPRYRAIRARVRRDTGRGAVPAVAASALGGGLGGDGGTEALRTAPVVRGPAGTPGVTRTPVARARRKRGGKRKR